MKKMLKSRALVFICALLCISQVFTGITMADETETDNLNVEVIAPAEISVEIPEEIIAPEEITEPIEALVEDTLPVPEETAAAYEETEIPEETAAEEITTEENASEENAVEEVAAEETADETASEETVSEEDTEELTEEDADTDAEVMDEETLEECEHKFVKGVCSKCGVRNDGFAYVGKVWGWYKDDVLQNTMTGLAKGTIDDVTAWYYISKGVYTKSTGLSRRADGSNDIWYYVNSGKFKKSTGITQKINSTDKRWFYVRSGVFTEATGLTKKTDGTDTRWFFVEKGIFKKASGITKKLDSTDKYWYYVLNGRFYKATGLTKKAAGTDAHWYYVLSGRYRKLTLPAKRADGSNNTVYYVDTGMFKKVTTWFLYSSNWYYFNKGAAVTGTKKLDGYSYTFNSNGVLTSTSYPPGAGQYIAQRIISTKGITTLKEAFTYTVNSFTFSYVNDSTYENVANKYKPGYGTAFMYMTRLGDCYHSACTFYMLAKELGYDAHLILGKVGLANGGYNNHSWVEIDYSNGSTYVYDPEFQHTYSRNGYGLTYGQSGTYKYAYYSRIN